MAWFELMQDNEDFGSGFGARGQQLAVRLRLAMDRIEESEREGIWAVVEAHQSGLSTRQMTVAGGSA